MRGEHLTLLRPLRRFSGSSPHARGTRVACDPSPAIHGIIPACAGNTEAPLSRGGRPGDHPRMRGEHSLVRMARVAVRGSSPHARGTPPSRRLALGYSGIIPACAGNTRYLLLAFLPPRDHPRMRGEHLIGSTIPPEAGGSSPHARGTRTGSSVAYQLVGIIPACAGNTQRCQP